MMFVFILFLKILLIILIAIILISIIILVVPYNYIINYNVSEHITGSISVKIVGGLLKFEHEKLENKTSLKVYLIRLQVYSKEYDGKQEEMVEVKALNMGKKVNLKSIGIKLIKNAVRYLYEIGNLVKPKVFVISGTYGFDDPLITGIIASIVPIVKTIVSSIDIYLNPVFLDEDVNIDIKCEGRLNIFVIGFKTLRFIIDNKVQKLFKTKNK